MDLHRHRSVLVRMTEDGRRLGTARITNSPQELRREIARAGKSPRVVLEGTYGWYWAADALAHHRCKCATGVGSLAEVELRKGDLHPWLVEYRPPRPSVPRSTSCSRPATVRCGLGRRDQPKPGHRDTTATRYRQPATKIPDHKSGQAAEPVSDRTDTLQETTRSHPPGPLRRKRSTGFARWIEA
jgi:hypothetical protein